MAHIFSLKGGARTTDVVGRADLVTIVECLISSFDLPQSIDQRHASCARAMAAAQAAEQRLQELAARVNLLERLAVTDELTGLLNRRGFETEVMKALAMSRRYNEPGVLIYIDVDGFKEINDTYGHATGDSTLKAVARILIGNVRFTDSVGRLGGDEFALLMPRSGWTGGLKRAQLLGRMLDPATVRAGDTCIEVRASFGALPYRPGEFADAEELLSRADENMYETKRSRSANHSSHLISA